jgi:ribosome biogenesis protein SSF1/2
MASMFQGMFPPIQVERVSCSAPSPDTRLTHLQSALPSFRRVLLISYQTESNLISVRHYTISVRPHGVSRRVRKLLATATTSKPTTGRKVDLGSAEDIADYLLRKNRADSSTPSDASGYTAGTGTNYDSASETDASEAESDSNAVELPEDYVGRGNKKGSRKAVRLVEMGPRMELRLVKIVEGLVGSKKGEGETVFHEFGKSSGCFLLDKADSTLVQFTKQRQTQQHSKQRMSLSAKRGISGESSRKPTSRASRLFWTPRRRKRPRLVTTTKRKRTRMTTRSLSTMTKSISRASVPMTTSSSTRIGSPRVVSVMMGRIGTMKWMLEMSVMMRMS